MRIAAAGWRYALGPAVVGLLLFGVSARSRSRGSDDCRFEQTWFAGDQHFNERLELRGDETGTWNQGGFDSDAGHDRKDFRWARTASTLTVEYDGARQHHVGYALERRGGHCYLTFEDHPFLADHSGFLIFSDSD